MKLNLGRPGDRFDLKRTLILLGGVLLPLVAATVLSLRQANYLVGRSLLIAFGDNESSYRSAWFEWDGDIVAKDLVVDPFGMGEEFTIRAEHVHVETPGWFWFAYNTFAKRKRLRTSMDEVHLTLTGVRSDSGFDPTLGDLGPFSATSASPFEAEGCANDNLWSREELVQMGLEPGPAELEFRYAVDGAKLNTTIRLEVPNVSKVVFERKEDLPRRINALLVDQYASLTRQESWSVEDLGFVRARNRFCAGKDDTQSRDLVERHVASVQRLLEMAGLELDDASLQAYRLFARDGGNLKLRLDYSNPLHSDDYYEVRDSGAALLQAQALLERGEQRAWAQFRAVTPRPLAGWDDGLPTYAALRAEQGGDTVVADEDGSKRISVRKVAAKVDMEEAGERDPALDAAVFEAPKAAAMPEPVQVAKVEQAPPPDPRIPWEQLNDYIGHDLRVLTATSGNRTVTLLEAHPGEILVSTRVGGGTAQFRIKKETFREAVPLQ